LFSSQFFSLLYFITTFFIFQNFLFTIFTSFNTFNFLLSDTFLGNDAGPVALRIAANPYVYGVIATNIAGIVTLQNSFHSARGIIAMPLSGALSNLVPIAGGMLAFGERLPANGGAAAMRIGAFVLTIAAGALLAVSREDLPAEPVVARAVAEN